MSDYLHHLVARTLAPDAGVRPVLRSAFEPPPFHGGFTLSAGLEDDTLVESTSSVSLPLNTPTQLERVPVRGPLSAASIISPRGDEPPRQIAPTPRPPSLPGDMQKEESNGGEDIASVQPLHPPDREPSMKPTVLQTVISSRAVSAPPTTSPLDPVPMTSFLRTAASDAIHPAAAAVPHPTVESKETCSEPVDFVAIRSGAPTMTVLSPSPLVAPTSDNPHPAAGAIRSQTVESEERRSERFTVAAIRPVAPAAPVFSPSLPRAVAPPPPAIHVTIGRVEVRATPPPAGSRAKATLPPVMSLGDYLRRRDAGGLR